MSTITERVGVTGHTISRFDCNQIPNQQMEQQKWMVELLGREEDLIDFTRWFPDEPAKVIRERNSFFLTGSLFRDFVEHTDVRSAAENEADLMAASVKLNCSGLSLRPEIGAVYRIDNNGARHAFAPVVNLGVKVGIEVRVFYGQDQRPTTMQRCVTISRQNKSLQMAMILWADSSRTWPRLYRILEEVENAVNTQRLYKRKLTSKSEYERFKQSANCHEIAGIDSRHGPKGHQPPRNPMTIAEAERFIGTILGRALSSFGDT